MIKNIYKNIVYPSKNAQMEGRKMDEFIDELLQQKKRNMTIQEFEQYRDVLYEVSGKAEEIGFTIGFKYGVEIIMESLENMKPTENT